MRRFLIDYFVLDTLTADLELFRDVVRLINHPEIGWREYHEGLAFEAADVAAALQRCVRDDLVEAHAFSAERGAVESLGRGVPPSGDLERCWFALTDAGRAAHDAWEPPAKA